ncbi:hypothetical protein HNY73_016325 [Argiope bruennichi]|uniref:Uncharacterized protein n=1 Tax=Argiope bruennichi TaxID=94029 RepID=A0A8T0EII6_ARGBR|nr:hypothetical protein HNY73_016325 [Argiope bruennichi]
MKGYHQIITVFIIFLISLNFFISGTAAENSKRSVRQKRNVLCHLGLTGFISGIFFEVLKGMNKYDPLPIGSLIDGKLQNGLFEGLSSLKNNSNINVDCEGELIVLSTVLDVSGAYINYQWSQKIFPVTLSGSVWTKVKTIQFALELTLDMTHGIKMDVSNLKLTKLDGLQFGFSGLGPLNPLIKIFGNVIFYDSLNSVHKYDPMFIGSLLNGKLTNVEFQGLSTLINDSNIDVYCQNEMVVLDTLLSLTDVSISCEWSQKVLLTFTGTITATVEDIQFQVDANLNMESGIVFDINVVLTKLDGIKLGFSGLGPLNPVIKMIGNLILDVFNREVSKKIGKVLKTTLESELGKYNTSF